MDKRFKSKIKPGMIFGELTTIERVGTKNTCALWLCKCSCGNNHEVVSNSLLAGRCKSCGCHGVKGNTGQKQIYNNYKSNCKSNGKIFEISRDDFYKIIDLPCHYCGSKNENTFTNWYTREKYYYNGIDRVDNKKGYIKDNIVPCCNLCNKFKHSNEKDEFINHCIKISNFQKKCG